MQSNIPLIGVWYQPLELFDVWQARGVNTLVGYEPGSGVALADWRKAAAARGLRYMLQWLVRDGKPMLGAADDADPNLLAVMLPDEPDGAGNLSPGQITDLYDAIKTLLPGKPVFFNADGWKTQWRAALDYRLYELAPEWLSCDYYPLNHDGEAAKIQTLGERLDFLQKQGGPGKRYFAVIETSNQLLSKQDWTGQPDPGGRPGLLRQYLRGPTAAEVVQEVAQAVKRGCGIIYFPDVIGTNWEAFDGTPADVAAALASVNQLLSLSAS